MDVKTIRINCFGLAVLDRFLKRGGARINEGSHRILDSEKVLSCENSPRATLQLGETREQAKTQPLITLYAVFPNLQQGINFFLLHFFCLRARSYLQSPPHSHSIQLQFSLFLKFISVLIVFKCFIEMLCKSILTVEEQLSYN